MTSKQKSTKNIQPTLQSTMPKVGDEYNVPVEGSLGLLALGAVGLIAWREKRTEAEAQAKQRGKNG